MSGLLGVPLEVLLQITSYLTTPEYGNLRITCRQVEALLFGAFAREFFSKRQFALIEFSLQALVNIAKSRFGSSLTHLIIHVEHPYTQFGNPTDSSPFRLRAIKENRLRIERFNHMQFTTTGLDAEMLTEAITRLPNLETIGMRDFNSGSRHRDNTSWASYGCPTFLKEAGPLALPGDDHFRSCGPEYTSHVFLTILRAIGNAALFGQSPSITRMEVLLHTSAFSDYSFKIPDRLEAGISLALSKLKTILLDGLIAKARLPYIHVEGDNGEIIPASGYFLSRFLARASSLEHLRLNFQKYEQSATEKVLLWLAGARVNAIGSSASSNASEDLPTHFPPAPKFPNLRNIDIGMATVTEPVLLALYRNYASTLRGISLHKVTLEGKSDGTINLWAGLCNKLARAGLEIRTLRMSCIRQISRDPERQGNVLFKEARDAKSWRGSTFRQSIKDITGEMESHWDDIDPDDIEDDDDDEDDEDDLDDEDE